MKNKSIERRVEAYYNMWLYGGYSIEWVLREIATEQDRISRTEERERCIKAAQKWYCENKCSFFHRFKTCIMCDKWNCNETEDIRKAIEEGGES